MRKEVKKYLQINKGQILVPTLIFGFVGLLFISAIAGWGSINLKSLKYSNARELALQISESGIEYYRWHLAHDNEDFTDGTGEEGPYVHDYLDKDGVKIGEFSLNITPPTSGTTMITIESTGTTMNDPVVSRTVKVRLAIPSWAQFAVVANDYMRFGEGTEVFGPIVSNKGIRFDGIAHNLVSSAVSSYKDPDHGGQPEFGVHTHVFPVDPYPPADVPERADVFMAGRLFPIPEVDFDGITLDMADMKDVAEDDGLYFSPSNKYGYHVVLKTDDTFDLYKVTSLADLPKKCKSFQDKWGTWSITGEQFVGNYTYPDNGIMFFEDDTWVNGQIDGARLTIIAAYFPESASKRKSIIINDNLLYTNYDGSDVIGLIAQDNINIGLVSADDLRVDAALISQNGRIGRYYYPTGDKYDECSPYVNRNSITLYGMIGSSGRYGFAYTDGTGYDTRYIYYDVNLLYSPPPNFPLTTDEYQVVSWEEI